MKVKKILRKHGKKKLSAEDKAKLNDDFRLNRNRPEFWQPDKERNPKFKKGDESSRKGFIKNPYFHDGGWWYQTLTKGAVKAAIHMAKTSGEKFYDKNLYVFDDPRIQRIDTLFIDFIKEDFIESYPYKYDIMSDISRVVFGLMKEDIYYRGRLFKLINKIAQDVSENGPYELTVDELDNIEKWH